MSKEEFLKIQTCVLKVNIHCDGCKRKVKKILQKIDGVYTTSIDSEQGKVTVSGNVDPATLIKKLMKNGKHAELWGAPKANSNNQRSNQINNQMKNMDIDNGKAGNNKGQGQKGGNNQLTGGQPGQSQQQLQQLQQMKGFQDLKLPQLKDLKMPLGKGPSQKVVKFDLPEEEDVTDDEFDGDDDYDDDDDDYDDFDDEMDHASLNKTKQIMINGHGGAKMPNMMMNVQNPQLMKSDNGGGNNGGNGGANGKKSDGSGGGNVPVRATVGGNNNGKNGGNGGKKGDSGGGSGGGNGNNNAVRQNQGGGAGKNGGKNGGGQPQDGKNGDGRGQNKNGNNGYSGGGANASNNGNGGKKEGGMNDGLPVMPKMMSLNGDGNMGQMVNMTMGQMGNVPMGHMGNSPAVQGLPAVGAMNGGGGGGGFFQGAGREIMAGNPYYQQQVAAMMMNQQRASGNERFQPMMYARPPPAVNYMPPYAYPYTSAADQYSSFFSDENTSSCSIM